MMAFFHKDRSVVILISGIIPILSMLGNGQGQRSGLAYAKNEIDMECPIHHTMKNFNLNQVPVNFTLFIKIEFCALASDGTNIDAEHNSYFCSLSRLILPFQKCSVSFQVPRN